MSGAATAVECRAACRVYLLSAERQRVLRAVLLLAMLCVTGASAAAPDAPDPLSQQVQPNPRLTPQQVVRAQLEALRRNDRDDRGIEVAFRFASPQNKRNTGPLPRFARMIKDGPYALMLRYVDASYAPVKIDGDVAAQQVTLIDVDQAVTFIF